MLVGCVPVIACTIDPSWMFDRRPTRIQWTSPRSTAHIHTLLSSPISTSPMTCALSSMKAVGWARGEVPRYGRSTSDYIEARQKGRMAGRQEGKVEWQEGKEEKAEWQEGKEGTLCLPAFLP